MSDNIKVFVKVRPLIPREIEDKLTFQWRVKNNTLYQLDQQKDGRDFGQAFTFDKVYDHDTKTSDVYNDVAKPIVEAATAGFNGTIFAYGQTSSGKTYTMTGTEQSPGIIPLAVLNLFEIIKNIPDRDFLVRVSYIEIYNETLKDLLDLEKENIKIHETLQGIKVDVTEKVTSSPEEVLDIMKKGEANRQTGSTNMNETSSRSHSIFQIIIESREHIEGEEQVGCVNVSQLNLVDLAGSERAGQTGATGLRFKEGTHINKSLSALALVIKQLSEGPNKYANYRDSKLTRILQNSLGGNAKTSIICAVTLATVEETISTLQFANRAKAIKNKPEVNAVATDATMIQGLTKELSKLQSQLESKKTVEQDNYNLQKQIAALQRLILNGFAQRRSVDFVDGARRKLQQQRRVTISTLHSIEDDPPPNVVKFRTPVLKYNPMSIPHPSEFVPIQNSGKLETLPEEPTITLITPPPRERKVNFSGEIIQLDSDDDDVCSNAPTCSPYHKCYDSSKTPPCILRKNAKQAEKNFQDIVELTEREKMYSPSVVELIEKNENYTKVIASLKEDVDNLSKHSKDKDLEMDQLKNKIKKTEEEVKSISTLKMELETQCNKYNTKLTDWEVSYETLLKKAKLREEELLTMLDEKNDKYRNPKIICNTLSRTLDKELTQFMDMSRDISLVNSDNESSIANPVEEPSALIQDVISDLKTQLTLKNQNLLELENNLHAHKQKISSLENYTQELQEMVSKFQEKLEIIESENSLLKSTVDSLNSTIHSQRVNLETANSNIESYNNVIQDLQTQLTTKENILKHSVCDNILESMIANEENIIANNENIRNIIYSFKNALETRSKEIEQLKSTIPNATELTSDNNSLKENIEAKTKQVISLNEEVHILKQQLTDNITTIDKLLVDKNNLEDVERDLTIKLTNLEKNKESSIAFDNLKETYNKLLLNIQDKDLKEQKMASLNEDLMMKVEEMNNKINNLEEEITLKENVIVSLKKDDEITQNNLDKAKSSVIKLNEILAILTDEIHEVPAVIDNFVFSTLSDRLNNLETTVIRVITEKDEAVIRNKNLQNELTATMNKYNTESSSLHLQIDNLTATANRFNEQNEILSKQLNELTSQLDQIRCEHSEKMEELVSLKDKANVNHEELSSKDNLIALLKDNECTLYSKIETLQQNGEQKCKDLQKEIESLTISLKLNKETFNETLDAKDKVITDLKLSFDGIETELKEKYRDLEIQFQSMMETSEGRDKLMTNILEKVTQITGDFHIENNLSCDFENMNVNIYEQILLTLDKIVNHITLVDSGCSDTETNFENILMEAKKEIREMTQQNLKLMTLLSEIEDKSRVMSLEIEKIQNENRSLKDNLLESHSILEQLKIELKDKVQEINSIEMKTRDWKEQFISLDQTMKQQIEEMQLENDQLKMKYLKLEMETTHRYNDPSDDLFSDPENNQDKINRRSLCNVDQTTETVSPPSLLTICCNTILDAIEPSETDTKSVTPSSSNVNIEKQSVESQVNMCQCANLLSELTIAENENIRLLKIMAELEYVNQQLLREQIEVRKEVELLLSPVNELHKKLVNHKTNLSILTATSYAENKSLKSQVKVLQHHHSRYHNVCQRDIPAFKNQLLELMSILKREQTLTNIDNSNLKRYSLPDVLDNNTTLSNFKNESTLDGDNLMLDTNVTETTLADTTIMGLEQSCLDLTLYNEACCQTNDLNQTIDPNIICSQVEILNSNYYNMLERLNVLKEENEKLRLQVHTNLYVNEPKIDAECSPIKINHNFNENSRHTKLNDSTNIIFNCEKCSNLDELQIKHDNLCEELNTLSEELIDIRSQKAEIEAKYQNVMLEMPSTDALVTKLQVLEKDYNIKLQENVRLTTTLHNKTKEFKQLQEENDTLSTQVMENISEADDLNKELDRLKELNAELTERCTKLVHSEKESRIENPAYVSVSCNQCEIKDHLINSLQTKNVPETHTKLNRSFSDSETSSRYNKICTLQSELDAGRADCKELTEEVATIKNHLERSNLSMDLDDSMGDSNIFGFKTFDGANSQYNKCNMPGIPEELPLDEYMIDKIYCINYYAEKTEVEKESMNYNVKIIDVLKMFHNNLITKHANEVENLVNRLKDFEDSKNHLQLQINNMTSEYSKAKDELEGKDKYFTKIVNVLSLIKVNTNIINNEMENNTDTDKTTKLISTFKLNFLKILDSEFGLSCGQVFDSLIDSIVNKHQNELIDITDRYTKLQVYMDNVTTELNSVNDNLTQLKCQLSDKENEYNLLKTQKERTHEISKSVTLDKLKNEQVLSESITKRCQELLELNIIAPRDIDLTSPIIENINVLYEYLINQHKNISYLEKEKELLAIEVKNSKSIIDEKQKQLNEMKIRNEKMQEINSTVTVDLVDNEKKLQTFRTLHEDLNKIYESKIEENKANLCLIENLTQEINILKETLAERETIAKSLESKIEAQGTARTSEKDEKVVELLNTVNTLQEDLDNLKSVNDMINKEKKISASELEKSSETIKRNKMDLEKMTSDILILRESVKENSSIIDNLRLEAKSLLKQNIELKEQLNIKCQECSRLENNIRTHEKTAEIQSKMIMRIQKQKEQDDKSKNKHLEELTEKWMQLQNECEILQNNVKTLNNENEALKVAKQSLEARIAELELEIQRGYKPRTSIDAIADTSRRRRQSLHDSKRLFAEDKHACEDHNNMDAVFESRSKPDDLFMDVDDNASDRSTPIRMSRGRDSLPSRTDQSDKDEEHCSRPSSVQATRRRRQSTHDLHRSVVQHTPSPRDSRLLEELNHLKPETGHDSDNSELSQLKQELSSCQQELEDLKDKYKELDDECETCAEYLRERDEQCIRLKKDKTALENTVKELKEKLQSSNISQIGDKRCSVADVSVNTDEDWANLHSVVVDRMSFDAEVEKNKRLNKTLEELRFKNQELKNTMAKMQKALEKNSGRYNNRELEATKLELESCKEDLEDLRQRYKELDEECETCAEYLRERDEQCRRLREAKLALEAKLEQMQEDESGNILQSVRKKRRSTHDQNRTLAIDVTDATTETSDDFLCYQVERDNSSQPIEPEAKSKEIKHLKMAVDRLSQQKAALENQVVSMSSAPKPFYVATGSAIVQSQQLTDVMKENQKLKKINAKLINLCKKRGKDPNLENVDPSEQG